MRSWVHCPYKTMSTSSKWLKHQLAPSVAQHTPLLDTWVRKSRCLSFTSPRLWCLLNLICYYCMCIYEYGVSRDTHLLWHMGEGQRASFRSLYSWLWIRCDEFRHLEFPAVPCDCELKCAFLCWATWASGHNDMTRGPGTNLHGCQGQFCLAQASCPVHFMSLLLWPLWLLHSYHCYCH